jgi:predicted dehydrogenase
MASEFGAHPFSDWEGFLAREDVDVVVICTPSGAHLDYGALAARAGKHVVVEKPIEVTVARGRQLIDTCTENRVHLSVIFQNHFVPDIQRMKQAIDAGEIGPVHLADAYVKWHRDQKYYDEGGWRGTLELDGGGALINQSIHTIDLLRWMVGDVRTVYGRIGTFTHERIEGEDTGVAVLTFANGAIGVIEGATSVQPPHERTLEIHGRNGSAVLTGNSFTLEKPDEETKASSQPRGSGSGAASPFSGFSIEPHTSQLEDIVRAIRNGSRSRVSGEEALKSLAIVEGIYRSSREGTVVTIA